MIKSTLIIIFVLHSSFIFAAREDNFTLNKNYVSIGDRNTPVKVEFGVAYKLLKDINLYAGYHQKSLWDVNSGSSPVLDSNYNPQLYYEYDGLKDYKVLFGIIEHLSNGQTDDNSRGTNMSYIMLVKDRKLFGVDFKFGFKAFVSYKIDNGSPDLNEYMGIWAFYTKTKNFMSFIEKEHFFELRLSSGGEYGEKISNGNLELSFHIKPTVKSLFFLYAQFFTGRNEYLLDYKTYTRTARLGLSLDY